MDSLSVQQFLKTKISQLLDVDATEIDAQSPLIEFNLGSVEVVGLIAELDAWLGITSPMTLLYEHENLQILSDHLAKLATRTD